MEFDESTVVGQYQLGISTTFGSLLSRAINGSASFWGTIGVSGKWSADGSGEARLPRAGRKVLRNFERSHPIQF
ncbi:hypothetical protein IQ274_35230 [Nostoc sp. LEGE 12447]|uniref:hypothetical protein n=1 Tax=Nostoc sp. LEGE 12447 TaxID=1828640 RepID=UPI0018840F13|nr:hypothetical protein [Nostoc sp. LEGE 12447]MBE9003272.1 hypothetical protein [Nostoc sp. LEGE 12447]